MYSYHLSMVKSYFRSWMDKNPKILGSLFEKYTYYSESWGPEYHGLSEIRKWFKNWILTGSVKDWTIYESWEVGETLFVEWHFRAEYTNGKVPEDFEGISIIQFSPNNKIMSVKEYASVLPKYTPGNLESEP